MTSSSSFFTSEVVFPSPGMLVTSSRISSAQRELRMREQSNDRARHESTLLLDKFEHKDGNFAEKHDLKEDQKNCL